MAYFGVKSCHMRARVIVNWRSLTTYGGRGGYFFKNLKVSKVASSALAEGATFEHFFQKKVAFSAVAEEATFFIASSAMAEEATFLKNIFLKTKK